VDQQGQVHLPNGLLVHVEELLLEPEIQFQFRQLQIQLIL
jgi:hypothetical protein